ncbi:MAG: hypothetical protein PWQ11_501 [Candidatus Diapherotrites archaeon]|nr:hypothetical protein [Candidatus Diapherotrites archaeon]
MRGYATVIASLIMFVVVVSAASVLFVSGVRESARISEAKQFREYVKSQQKKTSVELLGYEWNGDKNTLLLRLRNGDVPLDLNSIGVFVDGIYFGSCSTLGCNESNPDGKLLPGEDLNVSVSIPFKPYRVSVTAGEYGVTALSADLNNWHAGCKYRRLVYVSNPSASNLTGFQIPVDLDGNFDYSSASSSQILFTGPDGLTEIPFWVEYWDVSGQSRIWVRLDVPAGDSNYAYMYYACDSTPSYTPSDVFLHDLNLVAYWPFDEGNGSVAYDASGNGYDMNLYGHQWVSGIRGKAIYLDGGTDSYGIVYPFNGFPSTQITAIFWMETNDTNNSGVPLSYASSATPDDFALMNYRSLRIYVAGNYRWPQLAFNDGTWHQLATVWRSSDGNVSLYDNGAFVYTNTLSDGNTITDGGSLVVGQDQDALADPSSFDPNQAFIGTIDELMIFPGYLSADAVSDIYSEDYFVSSYYPGHLLVRRKDPGVSVSVRPREAYSYGG